jgi:hypothetical protein
MPLTTTGSHDRTDTQNSKRARAVSTRTIPQLSSVVLTPSPHVTIAPDGENVAEASRNFCHSAQTWNSDGSCERDCSASPESAIEIGTPSEDFAIAAQRQDVLITRRNHGRNRMRFQTQQREHERDSGKGPA